MLPILILTPHSSDHAPEDILVTMLGAAAHDEAARGKRLQHLFKEGDPYTDQIFYLQDAHYLPAQVSRFVVDLNRYRDDDSTNGVIKLVDFAKTPLYPPGFELGAEAREERLQCYWDSYHCTVEQVLEQHPIKLLIDGHSMTPFGPALGPDKGAMRPALTLMTGGDVQGNPKPGQRCSLPPNLARQLKALLEGHFAPLYEQLPELKQGVALNQPWDIDELADTYSDPARARAVPGFGLEINRALYLDTWEQPLPGRIEALNEAIGTFVKEALGIISEVIG